MLSWKPSGKNFVCKIKSFSQSLWDPQLSIFPVAWGSLCTAPLPRKMFHQFEAVCDYLRWAQSYMFDWSLNVFFLYIRQAYFGLMLDSSFATLLYDLTAVPAATLGAGPGFRIQDAS